MLTGCPPPGRSRLALPRQVVARCIAAALGAIGELAGLLALEARRLLALVVLGVRVDDAPDQAVPHDVVAREPREVDVVDVVEVAGDEAESAGAAGEVDLRDRESTRL